MLLLTGNSFVSCFDFASQDLNHVASYSVSEFYFEERLCLHRKVHGKSRILCANRHFSNIIIVLMKR